MKIHNLKNIDGLMEALDKCRGTVELITTEGDRLNLKSKLCQYVALSKLFKEAKIENIEIIAHEPEDLNLLFKFLVEGDVGYPSSKRTN
jgi:hypothetical protein